MIYKQIVGLSYGQKIAEIKNGNGDNVEAQINLIMEVSQDVPYTIGTPIQKFIEIISNTQIGFKVLDVNNKFVCQMYPCELGSETTL